MVDRLSILKKDSLYRQRHMRLLSVVALLGALGIRVDPSLAGPNEGGTLILHANTELVYTVDNSGYCGQADLSSCDETVTVTISDMPDEELRELLMLVGAHRITRPFWDCDAARYTPVQLEGRVIAPPALDRMLLVQYEGLLSPSEVSRILQALPSVIVASPVGELMADTTPNDPEYMGDPADKRWYLDRIGMSNIWSNSPDAVLHSPTWRIGVVDSGCDYGHPDLGGILGYKVAWGRLYYYHDDFPPEGGMPDSPGTPDCPGEPHGTNVTGVLAALTNNATGVASIAGGWHPTELGPQIVVGGFGVWGETGSCSPVGFGPNLRKSSWISSLAMEPGF